LRTDERVSPRFDQGKGEGGGAMEEKVECLRLPHRFGEKREKRRSRNT